MGRTCRAEQEDRRPGHDPPTSGWTDRRPACGAAGVTARAPADAGGERLLVRTEVGRLFDARTRRPVTLEGLADDVRCGRRFRVREDESGNECTYQVLAQVLNTRLAPTVPARTQAACGASGMAESLFGAGGEGSPPQRNV
ncbi:polyhydroxyalkanoate synthesis regulator DNA-binding domain-containing protein [Streptomyces sp. 058-1L]|uniref:polyhydroxyalkanoate synthesis regulator DNA-binding domain-containing protein n=1 Tax=Streptomyces sp. 058-1L TaxID=2789266 RepID=UPI0039810D5B